MISLFFQNPLLFVFYALAMVVAISVHEYAHARTAVKLGDPTPEVQGRLTLDPRSHLDMFGTLFLLLFGFGWGKPVQFDPFNLENPRKDAALISIAGPVSNFIIAIASSAILYLFTFINVTEINVISRFILIPMIYLNILLGVFNLIPVAPLDGFKIVGGLLSDKQAHEWYQLERYGILFLLMLIIPFGNSSMLQSILGPILSFLYSILIPTGGAAFFI